VKGRRMGIFGSRESLRLLLDANHLSAVVARSEMRMARLKRSRPEPTAALPPPPRSQAIVKSAHSAPVSSGDSHSP
jgi:hypothetical protein